MTTRLLFFLVLLAGCDRDGDGLDESIDCDDHDPLVGAAGTWYPDADGDTWGTTAGSVAACSPPSGFTYRDGDCDDNTILANPDVTETCDGLGLDDDCDGLVDDADPSLDLATTKEWYIDSDGDGFGDPASAPWQACDGGPGAASSNDDCDDTDASINPGVMERCDSGMTDEDCDGLIDDDDTNLDPKTITTWAPDADGDGYGEEGGASAWQCVSPGSDYSSDLTDCDDADADVHPTGTDLLLTDRTCDEATSADRSLALAEHRFLGSSQGNYAGASAVFADDIDGDGLSDLLIGSPGVDDYTGEVAVLLAASLAPPGDATISDVADHVLLGEGAREQGGYSSEAGDVDGDGLSDLIVSAYWASDGADYSGRVSVVFSASLGSETSFALADADRRIEGIGESDFLGYRLDAGGDVDGDGLSDLLLGSQAGTGGTTWLLLGADLSTSADISLADAACSIEGDEALDSLLGLTFADDADGDGLSEVILGLNADFKPHQVVVFSAADLSGVLTVSGATHTLHGETSGDDMGWSISASGDADGDGLSELLIGAPSSNEADTDAGKAYLLTGAALTGSDINVADADHHFLGEIAEDSAGYLVSLDGDIDGDGYDDLLIGAPGYDTVDGGEGAVYLVLGSSLSASSMSLTDADHRFEGESADGNIGTRGLTSGGDVDGDGRADVLIGAYQSGAAAESAGAAYLIFSGL